jgi:hypothetical protein
MRSLTFLSLLIYTALGALAAEEPPNFPGVVIKVRYFQVYNFKIQQSCLTIFPDNHYRLVRVKSTFTSDPETHTFAGILSQASSDDITNILQSEEFKKLQNATLLGPTTAGDVISWQIYVSRPERNQVLIFQSEGTSIHSPPKSFVAWFNTLQKQKITEVKPTQEDKCTLQGP